MSHVHNERIIFCPPQGYSLFLLEESSPVFFQPFPSKHLLLNIICSKQDFFFFKSSLSVHSASQPSTFTPLLMDVMIEVRGTESCLRAFPLRPSKYVMMVTVLLSTCHANIIPVGGFCFGMWQAPCTRQVMIVSSCRKFLSSLYCLGDLYVQRWHPHEI